MTKHEIYIIAADTPHGGRIFTEECLKNAVNLDKQIPITNRFMSSAILGWGVLTKVKDGKIKFEYELNEQGEECFKRGWILRAGGHVPPFLNNKMVYDQFTFTEFSLCPPIIKNML